MPITEKQLEKRRQHLGGSDLAAICGVNPYCTSYDLWLEKTGQLDEQKENTAMTLGTYLESGILAWAENYLGDKIIPNQYRSCKDAGIPIGVNCDGLVQSTGVPVEAKTAGLLWPQTDQWGMAGTDEVPEMYLVQTHAAMIATDQKECWLPALLGGKGFVMYHIKYLDDLAEQIIEIAKEWWRLHIAEGREPADAEPSLTYLKRRKRTKGDSAPLDPQLVENFLSARDYKKAAEDRYEQAQAALIKHLDDKADGHCVDYTVTYYPQAKKTYKPDPIKGTVLCEVNQSEFRVLRIKKAKKGK